MTTTKDPDNELAAPQGCSVVEVMTLIPTDPQFWGLDRWPNIGEDYSNHPEYLRVKEAFTDIMIRRLAEVIPGVEDHIVWCEAATPMTQQRCTRSSGGTPYGLELSITQFGPFRPGVRTEIAGLYLCGASMAWGPAVEGAMLSGMHAAGAVLGRNLNEEIRAGIVLGDKHDQADDPASWEPLATAKNLAVRAPRRPASTRS